MMIMITRFIDVKQPQQIHAMRNMMCIPESVDTSSLSCPTCSAKEASSKGFCICPRENRPRSPPRSWEPQSLSAAAICRNSCTIA